MIHGRTQLYYFTSLQPQLPQLKMMEVENRIEETFSGQVEELPDDLKERRVHGNHHANGNGNGNGVILEESEEEDQGDMEKTPTDASQAIAGRVIKKVCVQSSVLSCAVRCVVCCVPEICWNTCQLSIGSFLG